MSDSTPRRFQVHYGQGDGAGYVIVDTSKPGREVVYKSDNRGETVEEAIRLNAENPRLKRVHWLVAADLPESLTDEELGSISVDLHVQVEEPVVGMGPGGDAVTAPSANVVVALLEPQEWQTLRDAAQIGLEDPPEEYQDAADKLLGVLVEVDRGPIDHGPPE